MQKRFVGIDILRGVAALAVVVTHLHKWHVDVCGTTLPSVCGWISQLCDAMGSWGVGLFFVLSGVCIHLPAARAASAGVPFAFDLRRYAGRRFWRIYPPHLGALLLSWATAAIVAGPSNFDAMISTPTSGQLIAHLFLVHSFFPTAIYSINVVLWTIAIEAHFYALYPILIRVRRRWSMLAITAALFTLSLLLRVLAQRFKGQAAWSILLQNAPGRWWEWTLGAAVAEIATRKGPWTSRLPTSTTALGALALSSLCLMAAVEQRAHGILIRDVVAPFVYAAVVGVAMLVPFTAKIGPVASAAHWLGHRGYSLYLVHPIVLTLFIAHAGRLSSLGAIPQVGLAIVASIAGAAVYFGLVERWFLAGRFPLAANRSAAATQGAPL